jgi:geranylgeranyl reductase family protein
MFDCIVVGAGPAGATAAYHLAKRGRSVLMVEKASLPRYKPCSGGVSPAVAQWFDFDFSPVIDSTVSNIRYTWKHGDPVDAQLTAAEPMWMVRRDQFDHYVVQQAQKLGAELQDNTPVSGIAFQADHWVVSTANGQLQAKYLIAADGATGPMRQWLGFDPAKLRQAASLEVSGPSDGKAQFEFGLVKNGFIWSFPKTNGYSLSASTFRGGDDNALGKQLDAYATKAGLGSGQGASHPIYLWDGDQTLHTQNALLAGETAGIVDPLLGEGVRPAMYTGVLAAAAIDAALNGNAEALAGYTQQISQEWGSDMAWAQKLAGVFYRLPGVGYKVAIKKPAATNLLGKILCGELRYGDVAGGAIKKLSGGLFG